MAEVGDIVYHGRAPEVTLRSPNDLYEVRGVREDCSVLASEGGGEVLVEEKDVSTDWYVCHCCGERAIVAAELCAACAEGNDPFVESKYKEPRRP